jgi:hypothetical protein
MRSRVVALASVGLAAVTLFFAPAAAEAKAKPTLKPVVSKLSYRYSPTGGGMSLVISGKNFTRSAKVKFGGTPAKSVKFVSKTKLAVVSPKHLAGKVDVRVSTKAGTSKSVRVDKFTFMRPFDSVGYEEWHPVTDSVKGLTFQLPGTQSTDSTSQPLTGGQSNTYTYYDGDLPDWYVTTEVSVVTTSAPGAPVLAALSDAPQNVANNVLASGAKNVVVSPATPVTVGAYQGVDFSVSYTSKYGNPDVWYFRKIDTGTARITILTGSLDPFLTPAAASAIQTQLVNSLTIPAGI